MTENALALIEEKNLAQYFAPKGLDPVIEAIRTEVMGVVGDISTEKGRDEIRSRAFKVAKSKTAMDEMGKKLTEDQKKQIKAVDVERARAWDALEAIQKEVRQPLSDWENADKERIAGHEAALAAIPEHPGYGQHETAEEIRKRLNHLENLPPRKWEEFDARAAKITVDEISRTKTLLAAAQKREAEQAELARLRQEEADRKQREHEERLKTEAAATAKAEAEEKARKEAEAQAARVKAEQDAAAAEATRLKAEADKAEQDLIRIQREKDQAIVRAKKAEEDAAAAIVKAEVDKKAAAEKATRERVAAAEQAKRDEEAAVHRERERVEAEKKAEAEAAAKREADKKHMAKINNEALNAIIEHCNSEEVDVKPEVAKALIAAIAKGLIPHVKISY